MNDPEMTEQEFNDAFDQYAEGDRQGDKDAFDRWLEEHSDDEDEDEDD